MKTLNELIDAGLAFREQSGTMVLDRWPCIAGEAAMGAMKDHLVMLDWLTKRTARHEYFMADRETAYSYGSGIGQEEYRARPMSYEVSSMMKSLNRELGTKFNGCFLNKYDNEHQHLGWHADDFAGMDPTAAIAVLSFGAEREIWVKPQGEMGHVPRDQRILLKDGSCFIMPPGYQQTHFHRIPKHDRPCGWRISLTFREFIY